MLLTAGNWDSRRWSRSSLGAGTQVRPAGTTAAGLPSAAVKTLGKSLSFSGHHRLVRKSE